MGSSDSLICCCCGFYVASKPNGFCEYCSVLCVGRLSKGLGCKVLESLHDAEHRFVDVSQKDIFDGICPFTNFPCKHVDSCDDVLALLIGELLPHDCSCAVDFRGDPKK